MGQNTPAEERRNKPKKQAAGRLKRDINLLPANRNRERLARNIAISLAVAAGLAVVATFALMAPTMVLNALRAQVEDARAQLDALQQNEATFNALIGERDALQGMATSLEAGAGAVPHPSDVFAKVGNACPAGVTLTALTIDAAGLTIEGRAGDDGRIAQFIVNLAALPDYASVRLAGVRQEEGREGQPGMRAFTVSAALPQAAQTAATAAPEGGEGQ